MLKVVIADDEPEIASGIAFLIKRYCSDICEVAGIAHDGLEGYKLILIVQPDIVLSDIRMPECDGLEMLTRLKDHEIEARFVILSGYAEFSYAKKAMQLGVSNFLTKPIDEDELRNTLVEICDQIKEKKHETDAYESLQGKILDIDLKDFLLHNKAADIDRLKTGLGEMGFPADGGKYICALFKMKETYVSEVKMPESELFDHNVTVLCTTDCLAMICMVNLKCRMDDVVKELEHMKELLLYSGIPSVCIGIGIPASSFDELSESYKTAELALNYRILKGDNSVIQYKEIEEIESHTDIISDEDMRELEEAIDTFDDGGYEKSVHRIFEKIRGRKDLSLAELQQISLNLVLFGIRKTSAAQLQLNQFLGKNIFTLESIQNFNSIDQLENWIINTLKGMSQVMLNDNHSDKQDVVQEAKAYIRQNFTQNISLNDISAKFYINPYYFSQLFKKKTGIKYQDYVIELRVDLAKKLLKETDLKLYEICTQVGYSDMNHFNRVFERTTGVKPSEYRKSEETL